MSACVTSYIITGGWMLFGLALGALFGSLVTARELRAERGAEQ